VCANARTRAVLSCDTVAHHRYVTANTRLCASVSLRADLVVDPDPAAVDEFAFGGQPSAAAIVARAPHCELYGTVTGALSDASLAYTFELELRATNSTPLSVPLLRAMSQLVDTAQLREANTLAQAAPTAMAQLQQVRRASSNDAIANK
jgi:hypothetical protein